MHMPPPSAEETAKAVELGHEPSTVSVRGVVWFFAVFFIFGAVVQVIVWVIYKQLVTYEGTQNVQRSAVVMNRTNDKPDWPLLQPTKGVHERTENDDLMAMKCLENLEFVRRGWIYKESGDFHLPEDLVQAVPASNGAPITASPTTNPSAGAGMARCSTSFAQFRSF